MSLGYTLLDGVAIRNLASKYLVENFVQGILHIEGVGCTSKYTEDTNLNSIDIPRVKMGTGVSRTISLTGTGSGGISGNAFINSVNSTLGYVDTAVYNLAMNEIYDVNVGLPSVANDMNGMNNIQTAVSSNIIKTINKSINAAMLAAQIKKMFENLAVLPVSNAAILTTINGYTATASDEKGALKSFLLSNQLLSNGDSDNGFDMFDPDKRQAFIKPQFKSDLGMANISNASVAGVEMLSTGFLNPFTQAEGTRVNNSTGLCGQIDGVQLTQVSSAVWDAAFSKLGITLAGTADAYAILNSIQCLIVAGEATFRGLALSDSIKVVNATTYQGWILQPKARWGVTCISPKSVKAIVTTALTPAQVATVKAIVNPTSTAVGPVILSATVNYKSGDTPATVAATISGAAISIVLKDGNTSETVTGQASQPLTLGENHVATIAISGVSATYTFGEISLDPDDSTKFILTIAPECQVVDHASVNNTVLIPANSLLNSAGVGNLLQTVTITFTTVHS